MKRAKLDKENIMVNQLQTTENIDDIRIVGRDKWIHNIRMKKYEGLK